jgi:hypothetical protein
MIKVSSRRASDAEGQVKARARRLLSAHIIGAAAAIFVLAGGVTITSSAHAQATQQAQSPADCVEKCKADEKQCLYNGSSEELCDYDSKGCQKACNERK